MKRIDATDAAASASAAAFLAAAEGRNIPLRLKSRSRPPPTREASLEKIESDLFSLLFLSSSIAAASAEAIPACAFRP